jgi:hypothetical protein
MITSSPPPSFTLHRDCQDRLVLTMADGRAYTDVEPVRARPILNPDQWICLCDVTGEEIFCLPTLDGLAPAVRQLLEEELRRRQFSPIIRRIVSVSANTDPSQWDIETDRGEITFLLPSEDDIRQVPPHRVVLVDVHGIRYLIPDQRQLDAASRRILDRYI